MTMTTWKKYEKGISYPALQEDVETDVTIIGGGMAGILNAYFLTKAGFRVALIEKKELCSGATMATTAFITKVIDTDLSEVASIFSVASAKKVWESGQAAIEEYDRIISEENIECEFTRCPN